MPEDNTYMGPATISYGSGGAFAYQAIAGVSMPFLFRPGLEATLEYRFFGTARANIRGTATAQTTNLINGLIPSGQDTHGYLPHENSVSFGLRYRF